MKLGHVESFEPDWAAPGDWAAMYRACTLQVVPSYLPTEHQNWKRPALADWKSLQEELVPEATFERWYGAQGENSKRPNMGLLTGRASSNVFVIDLDEYKTPDALSWWHGVLAEHNNGMEPETCQQVTGGGGRQLFFRAPADWHAPTNKTPIGVDIRGQGGFAVLPPSLHVSGKPYEWKPGCSPWETEIATAPEWLLRAVLELVERYGGDQHRTTAQGPTAHTASPAEDFDAFGGRVDGRDHYMRDLIWAAVTNWYRECPIPPSDTESQNKMREAWAVYARKVKSRLPGDNAAGLEQEGRGATLFAEKWRRAMGKWSTEIAEAAQRPLEKDEWREATKPEVDTGIPPKGQPLLLSAAQFVAGFTPPEYLVDGIMQRGYLYSLTARTGHGKTAISMYLAQCVARGLAFHGADVMQGTVLLLAGENPDDIRARFLVLADAMGFAAENLKMRFIAGVVDIGACMPTIQAEAAEIDDLVLVIVDTAAAYFKGDDSNSNSQQGEYARQLRQLSFLPGKPAVLVNCHPIKNAAKDNLLPMGGSAFLNEVDGNLTLWSTAEKQTTLHWQGKFRGPEFEPMAFTMRTVESTRVVNSSGEMLPSVVAEPVNEMMLQIAESSQDRDEVALLGVIARNKNASLSTLATLCGFYNDSRKPMKSKVERLAKRLKDDKLIEAVRGKLRITAKGKREIGWDDD